MENKYIITLEEIPFERFHSYNVTSERLYRVQGFNSLVFDGNGLSKLTPYTEPNLDAIRKEAYQRGLVDAWETVRKIADLPTVEERENIFACAFTNDVIRLYTATEAIEKIRQYEKEQEEIRVGDEVIGIYSSGEQTKPFVITKWISDYYFGIYSDSGEFCQGGLKLQKTGRYFPEIAEVLKKMQEETA